MRTKKLYATHHTDTWHKNDGDDKDDDDDDHDDDKINSDNDYFRWSS